MSGIWQEPFESDNAFSTLGAELGVSFLVVNKSPILLFQHSYRDKGRSLYKYLTVINILYCTFVLLHEIIIDRITQMIIFYCYWKYYFCPTPFDIQLVSVRCRKNNLRITMIRERCDFWCAIDTRCTLDMNYSNEILHSLRAFVCLIKRNAYKRNVIAFPHTTQERINYFM